MDKNLRARELLADEYDGVGLHAAAHRLRTNGQSGTIDYIERARLRAIEKALSPTVNERLVEDVARGSGLVERQRYHQNEASRLAREIAGDPIGGVIIGPRNG